MKLFKVAFKTLISDPRTLTGDDDGKEFWKILDGLKGKEFKDKDFPDQRESLITDWREDNDEVRDSAKDWKDIEWLRARKIPELNDRDGKLAIFSGGIEPNDIQQRSLGDCYFLSVLSALAEKPERVRRLFISSELNDSDVYGIRCTKNGESKLVTIDGSIPCK